MPERYMNFVGGRWTPSKTGKWFPDVSPADTSDVVGEFCDSSADDLNDAVEAAAAAYPAWRATPAPKRAEIVFRVGEILRDRKEELSRDMTREMGKVLAEARGDVQEGLDTAYLAAGEGRRLFGKTAPSELPNKAGYAIRQPIGVAGIITPWNFPMAIPTWKIFPALVSGNTVVFKPASDVPKSAWNLVKILDEAGIPKGVVNFVCGGGSAVGTPLVLHPKVPVISFTGGTDVGKKINADGGRMLKRISLELGGKNAQVVLDDADVDLAVDAALWGGFGTTGQRCTATSRVILQKGIRAKFLEKFIGRVRSLKVGNGLDAAMQVGPVVNKGRIPAVHEYVEIGKKEGAKLLCGGSPRTDGDLAKGHFYAPTVFDEVAPTMRIAREEIFGPVVSVLTANDLEDAIRIQNDVEYGLSSAIFTRDVNKAYRAIEAFEAGIVYVNSATIGAEAHFPFGGVKATGNGHREGGWTVFDNFTEWKTVYVDYSGHLQRAQIDNN